MQLGVQLFKARLGLACVMCTSGEAQVHACKTAAEADDRHRSNLEGRWVTNERIHADRSFVWSSKFAWNGGNFYCFDRSPINQARLFNIFEQSLLVSDESVLRTCGFDGFWVLTLASCHNSYFRQFNSKSLVVLPSPSLYVTDSFQLCTYVKHIAWMGAAARRADRVIQ
jgi:hypothetical protein